MSTVSFSPDARKRLFHQTSQKPLQDSVFLSIARDMRGSTSDALTCMEHLDGK